MKLFSHIAMFAAGMLALASCSDESIVEIDVDDPFVQPGDRAATIEVPLRFHVEKPSLIGKPLVNDIPSRAEGKGDDTTDDPEKAAEEAINDIWVFQYDENGNQLIVPRFYKVESSEIRKLNIRLAEGNDSHVYVLANTGDETWAQDKDFSTVEKFVSYEYPFTEDNVEMGEDERLLMEGHVESTIRKETDLHPIDIHLTRMMAKISFKYVTAAAASNLVVNRVIINNMPMNMRMEETPKEENYPTGEDFETRSVTLDNNFSSGKVYTFYMPANRRGTSSNTDPKLKNNGAPDKALYVQLFVSSKSNGSNYLYTI
ncbi:fimbrial protein, partial [uncultured Muribaculum sp.]